MTYMTGDAVLFVTTPSVSTTATNVCLTTSYQTELFEQCQRYYANILTPFSRLVTPKILRSSASTCRSI